MSEAAWLAGLFEGEGSVGVYNNSPRLSIGQHERSKDVLEKVIEITGIGAIYGPYRTKNPVVFYQINKAQDIKKFIQIIYHHLLERRKGQCDVVLDFINSK